MMATTVAQTGSVGSGGGSMGCIGDLATLQDVRGHLIVGHRFIDPGGAPWIIARNLLTRLAIQHARSLLRRKFNQNAALHVSHRQIVAHQGALMMPALAQNVLSEEARRVADV